MDYRRYGGIMIELVRRRMTMRAKLYDAEVEWIQGVPGYMINCDVEVNNNGYSIVSRVLVPSSSSFVDIFDKTTLEGGTQNLWYLTLGHDNRMMFNVNTTYEGFIVNGSIRNTLVDVNVFSNTVLLRWKNTSASKTVSTPATGKGTIRLFNVRRDRADGVRMYYFRLQAPDGSIIRDMIPVRKGNIGYMYDKVSGRIFGNASTTGYAIIGPDKTA